MDTSLVLLYRNRNNDWAIRILQQHTIGRELTEPQIVNTFRNLTSMTTGSIAREEVIVLEGTTEIPKTFSKFVVRQILGEDTPILHTWRMLRGLQDEPNTIPRFYENLLEKIALLTSAVGVVQTGDRYMLIYRNDANAIAFRILSQLEMTVEGTEFTDFSTEVLEIANPDMLGIVRLPPKDPAAPAMPVYFAHGKVRVLNVRRRQHSSGKTWNLEAPGAADQTQEPSVPGITWRILDDIEKSTDLDNWLYDYLEKVIPKD